MKRKFLLSDAVRRQLRSNRYGRMAVISAVFSVTSIVAACGVTSSTVATSSIAVGHSSDPSESTNVAVDFTSFEALDRHVQSSPRSRSGSARDAPRSGSCGALTRGTTVAFVSGDCESEPYRITEVVDMPNQCPSDSDQTYVFGDQSSFYTLCLDVNWDPSRCYRFSTPSTVALSPCEMPGEKTFAPTKVISGTNDARSCGTSAALPHSERMFVVCLRTVSR